MVKVHSNHSRKQPNRAMKTEVIIIPMIGPFSFILIGACTIGLFMKKHGPIFRQWKAACRCV